MDLLMIFPDVSQVRTIHLRSRRAHYSRKHCRLRSCPKGGRVFWRGAYHPPQVTEGRVQQHLTQVNPTWGRGLGKPCSAVFSDFGFKRVWLILGDYINVI